MSSVNILAPQMENKNRIRSVSSVEFSINGDDAFEKAVSFSARWMRRVNSVIPREALKGVEFEVGGGGDHPARAVTLDYPEGKVWSATIDNPDNHTIGRTWITEITIANHQSGTHFGARLLNLTRKIDEVFVPSVPNIVRTIINSLNCTKGGVRLFSRPTYINDDNDLDWLIALLGNPSRRLPIIAMAEAVKRPPLLHLEELSKRVCGTAHVVGIGSNQQTNFRKYTGRDFAVFDGSVRIFNSGFNIEEADRYSHPLWIPTPKQTSIQSQNAIISRVLALSVSKGTTDYPRFQAVRQAAAAEALSIKRAGSNDAEMLILYEQENDALRKQLESLRDEQNQWLADSEVVRADLERKIEELKSDAYKYKLQNEALRKNIAENSTAVTKISLDTLENIQEWADANSSDRVWIAPKAIKEAEKNTQYRNHAEIGDALYLLDELYARMKVDSEVGIHEKMNERLEILGMLISSCFSNQDDIKRFPAYSVIYKGEKIWCDMHLKRGGGTDPRSMFRIYFHWHTTDEVVIIGHMPTHLDNNLTN
ncbi:hypothetical protein [Methylobacterium sp. Gmos1]